MWLHPSFLCVLVQFLVHLFLSLFSLCCTGVSALASSLSFFFPVSLFACFLFLSFSFSMLPLSRVSRLSLSVAALKGFVSLSFGGRFKEFRVFLFLWLHRSFFMWLHRNFLCGCIPVFYVFLCSSLVHLFFSLFSLLLHWSLCFGFFSFFSFSFVCLRAFCFFLSLSRCCRFKGFCVFLFLWPL